MKKQWNTRKRQSARAGEKKIALSESSGSTIPQISHQMKREDLDNLNALGVMMMIKKNKKNQRKK